ncbi:hypothetical protein HYS28_03650 [Candidatus Uhrbacteria bacterium]|nr:hypothetical protein [Candidatus Uhrbacteria bacterium]
MYGLLGLLACGIEWNWPWERDPVPWPADTGISAQEEDTADTGGTPDTADGTGLTDTADTPDGDCEATLVVTATFDGGLLPPGLGITVASLDESANLIASADGTTGSAVVVPCGRTRVMADDAWLTRDGVPVVTYLGDVFVQGPLEFRLTEDGAEVPMPLHAFVGEGTADCDYAGDAAYELSATITVAAATTMVITPYGTTYPSFLYPGSSVIVSGSTFTMVSAGPGDAVIETVDYALGSFAMNLREQDAAGNMWFGTFACRIRE